MLQGADFGLLSFDIRWRQVERDTIAKCFDASNLAVEDALTPRVDFVAGILIGEHTLSALSTVSSNVSLGRDAGGVNAYENLFTRNYKSLDCRAT